MGALIRYASIREVRRYDAGDDSFDIWYESLYLLSEHHPFRSISQHDAPVHNNPGKGSSQRGKIPYHFLIYCLQIEPAALAATD